MEVFENSRQTVIFAKSASTFTCGQEKQRFTSYCVPLIWHHSMRRVYVRFSFTMPEAFNIVKSFWHVYTYDDIRCQKLPKAATLNCIALWPIRSISFVIAWGQRYCWKHAYVDANLVFTEIENLSFGLSLFYICTLMYCIVYTSYALILTPFCEFIYSYHWPAVTCDYKGKHDWRIWEPARKTNRVHLLYHFGTANECFWMLLLNAF